MLRPLPLTIPLTLLLVTDCGSEEQPPLWSKVVITGGGGGAVPTAAACFSCFR